MLFFVPMAITLVYCHFLLRSLDYPKGQDDVERVFGKRVDLLGEALLDLTHNKCKYYKLLTIHDQIKTI